MLRHKTYWCFLWCLLSNITVAIAQEPELVLPTGHTEIVRTARFSPDGKYVLTGGADKTVNVWETVSGKKIQSLGGNSSDLSYAFFSNDGRYIAAGTDSTVIIWSVPAYTPAGRFNLVKKTLFTPDSKKLFLLGFDGKVRQLSLSSMVKEFEYPDNIIYPTGTDRNTIREAVSPDSRMFCGAAETSFSIRDTKTGKLICKKTLKGKIKACVFSNDGKYLITVTDNGIQQTDLQNKFALHDLSETGIESAFLSNNNRFLLAASGSMDDFSILWDLKKYKVLFRSDTLLSVNDTFQVMGPDSNYIDTTGSLPYNFPRMLTAKPLKVSDDGRFIQSSKLLWNTTDPRTSYEMADESIRSSDISSNGKYALVQEWDGRVGLWDIAGKKIIQRYRTRADNIRRVAISPDGRQFIMTSFSRNAKIIDIGSGKTVHVLKGHRDMIAYAAFSKDGKTVLTNSYDSTAKLWDAATGNLLQDLPGQFPETNPAYFDMSGKLVLSKVNMDTMVVMDPLTMAERDTVVARLVADWEDLPNERSFSGRYELTTSISGMLQLLDTLQQHALPPDRYWYPVNAFSPNDKMLAMASNYLDTLFVWDIEHSKWAFNGSLGIISKSMYGHRGLQQLLFTADNNYLLAVDVNAVIHILSTRDFKELGILPGQRCSVSADNKYLLSVDQGKIDVYDLQKRKLLYTYVSIDSSNHLVLDPQKRFDGTELARKLLYYACGNEIVDLDQAKDQLWVPGLAERIMKGDSINAKTLDQLKICGLTPEVENGSTGTDEYYFKIKPRAGGLGETVVYVNGIEAKRFKPEQLKKMNGGYELRLKKAALSNYFIPGKENPVTVKAYTADNTISSRGLIINEDKTKETTAPPNLYAVMVGVSDYKGNDLDLRYPAKDAKAISAVVAVAARKFLNKDGTEHVFMYDLTTTEEHYLLPEKISIRKTLEEIGRKATANDILLIFFAGHGVMAGEAGKKQFYFLTADASGASATDAVKEVGISSTELVDWMNPERLKAQKRILILDACNSGQAINDIAGKNLAVRNDDKAQQTKAIDKLNEKSGLFILSASASSQSAYEMGRYAHGLLTYSLLISIKQQPDILEDGKYLNLARWFDAAEKTVNELSRENGARQDPQIVSNTNFNIGEIDEPLRSTISLPTNPMFTASVFVNSDEAADGDDLKLSRMINLQLETLAAAAGNTIDYTKNADVSSAISLSGRYDVKNNDVTVRISIKKNDETRYRFEEKGQKDKLKELVDNLVKKAAEWAAANK